MVINMHSCCDIIQAELQTYKTAPMPSIEDSKQIVLSWCEAGAWNTCELCRIVNGHDPFEFRGCFWTVKEKAWNSAKGNCKAKDRGCRILRQTLNGRLQRLQKKGLIKSIKINWLDGRSTGKVDYIPTDYFRYWYTDRDYLGARLIKDVWQYIGTSEGCL